MSLYGNPQEVHIVDQLADLFGVTADQPVGDFYQVVKLLICAVLPFSDPFQDALHAVQAVAG